MIIYKEVMVKRILKLLIVKLKYWNKVRVSLSDDIDPKSIFEGYNRIAPDCFFQGIWAWVVHLDINLIFWEKLEGFARLLLM